MTGSWSGNTKATTVYLNNITVATDEWVDDWLPPALAPNRPLPEYEFREYSFGVNAVSADASGCEVIQAAPGADKNLYLEYLVICCDGDITLNVGCGEYNSEVESRLIGPIPCVAEGTVYTVDRRGNPFQLEANKPLTIDASGAGNIFVYAEGYSYP